jgi:hypothetical protein
MKNILIFFDYISYRISNVYIIKYKEVHGFLYGICVVTIMQMFQILLLLNILAFISSSINYYLFKLGEGKNFLHSWIIWPSLFILGFNYYRYIKIKPFTLLDEKWKDEPSTVKKKNGWLILIYIISNFAITITLSIYRKYYL